MELPTVNLLLNAVFDRGLKAVSRESKNYKVKVLLVWRSPKACNPNPIHKVDDEARRPLVQLASPSRPNYPSPTPYTEVVSLTDQMWLKRRIKVMFELIASKYLLVKV